MNLSEALNVLPDTDNKVLSVHSGGMDSSIMTMLLVEKYGKDKVETVSYRYGQKQAEELVRAQEFCRTLGILRHELDLTVLGYIAREISANIVESHIKMPTIKEVLGDPQPKTYVPFRNLILLSMTLAQAEARNCNYIFTGLQVHDEYGYWDTSQKFVDSINAVADQNRTHKVKVIAPFSHLSKYDEIKLCQEMGKEDLLEHTLTCYNPDSEGRSCGKCPSCSERIANFIKAGVRDPIVYVKDLPWTQLLNK